MLSLGRKSAKEFYKLIAPHIVGNEDTKKAISLQLFTRPEIDEKLHILLIGTVGTGKSECLVDVTRISNALYATSKVSKAGLAGATIGGEVVPGILTEADGGILAVDELDKIGKEELSALLEAMQKGTTTIVKALHHISLPSRCNIIAAANPINGKWSSQPSVNEIPFDMPLLSRFHLVIPYKEISGKMYPEIARSINFKYNMISSENEKKRAEFVKKYVEKAKEKVPKVDIPEFIVKEVGRWVGILKEDSKFSLPITPRLIEGMISMIRACARVELRSVANNDDLEFVKRLVLNIWGKWG